MTNPPALFSLFGRAVRTHWTVGLTFPLVAAYGLATESAFSAVYYPALALAAFACVALQALVNASSASQYGLGTRDVVLFPFWATVRYAAVSERPWQEIYLAAAGPLAHGVLAAVMLLGLSQTGHSAAYPAPEQYDFGAAFLAHLGWCNLLLALLHLFPALPLGMGQLFRAALSMTTGRLHATETACHLSAIGALTLLLVGLVWLHSPLLACLAASLYLSSQEDLGRTRYFASITADRHDVAAEPVPSVLIPLDQVVDAGCRPPEPRFTGFTWNRKTRLWVQWLEGRAVGANALVGD